MSIEVSISNSRNEHVPGKDKSLADIDKAQRELEAAIDNQKPYRT